MDQIGLYWFQSLQQFRPYCSKMLKTKHTPQPGVSSHYNQSIIFNFYLTCQCGCQRHNVWAPVFYSCYGICILPKFLRRHKGRMIINVTATTRIRPSTYHALCKTFEKYHEHTSNPSWHFSHSSLIARCANSCIGTLFSYVCNKHHRLVLENSRFRTKGCCSGN